MVWAKRRTAGYSRQKTRLRGNWEMCISWPLPVPKSHICSRVHGYNYKYTYVGISILVVNFLNQVQWTIETFMLTYRILEKKASQKCIFFLVPKLVSPPNPSLKLQTAFLTIWNILYSYFFYLPHNSSVRLLWAAFKMKYVRIGECVLYCTVTLRSNTHVLFGMWPIFFLLLGKVLHIKNSFLLF